MNLFLDPNKPLATCVAGSCDNCPVSDKLHCHFSMRDLIQFLLIAFPGFLLGGYGIYNISGQMVLPWLAIIMAYFGFVEIRVMCSHCPHYAEEGKSLKCWANYGSPKLWKYRPGPMTGRERIVFLAGFVLVWGYPIVFLVSGFQWFLLLVYLTTVAGFFMTVKTFLCTQCINFACPLNRVGEDVRMMFFERNPRIAKAWGVDEK